MVDELVDAGGAAIGATACETLRGRVTDGAVCCAGPGVAVVGGVRPLRMTCDTSISASPRPRPRDISTDSWLSNMSR
jgi:hypothetical protein